MPAPIAITSGHSILAPARTRLSRLHRRGVNDVDPSFGHEDALGFQLAVHLSPKPLPQTLLHQPGAEPPQRRGLRNPATQLKRAELAKQSIPLQTVPQLHIRQTIPDSQQQTPKQGQQRIAGTPCPSGPGSKTADPRSPTTPATPRHPRARAGSDDPVPQHRQTSQVEW